MSKTAKICECCGQPLKASKPKGRRGKYHSIWPAPVYEAHMSDGEVIRMSFYSEVGKPLDMARGRRLIQSVTPATIRYGQIHLNGQTIGDDATMADVKIAA